MSSAHEKVQKLIDVIQQHARIHNVEATRKKLLKVVEDGLSNLHIICGRVTLSNFLAFHASIDQNYL